jgi:hypothetical protein
MAFMFISLIIYVYKTAHKVIIMISPQKNVNFVIKDVLHVLEVLYMIANLAIIIPMLQIIPSTKLLINPYVLLPAQKDNLSAKITCIFVNFVLHNARLAKLSLTTV